MVLAALVAQYRVSSGHYSSLEMNVIWGKTFPKPRNAKQLYDDEAGDRCVTVVVGRLLNLF